MFTLRTTEWQIFVFGRIIMKTTIILNLNFWNIFHVENATPGRKTIRRITTNNNRHIHGDQLGMTTCEARSVR